jgi:hypothetical protein
LFWC